MSLERGCNTFGLTEFIFILCRWMWRLIRWWLVGTGRDKWGPPNKLNQFTSTRKTRNLPASRINDWFTNFSHACLCVCLLTVWMLPGKKLRKDTCAILHSATLLPLNSYVWPQWVSVGKLCCIPIVKIDTWLCLWGCSSKERSHDRGAVSERSLWRLSWFESKY